MRRCDALSCSSRRCTSTSQLGGLVPAGGLDGAGRLDAVEEGDGVRSVEFLGDSSRSELHQQVVEAAHDPSAVVADVDVALGQQAQDLGMVGGKNLAQPRRSQRGDRDGKRVVRVVLVRPPGAQDTDPRGQGRGYVQDGLAGGDELLGQQVAESAGGLDGPSTRVERLSPCDELVGLSAAGAHLLAGQLLLAAADRNGCVGRLVRVDTDDHCHGHLRGPCGWDPRRALLLRL
jgi:hypothetical protein